MDIQNTNFKVLDCTLRDGGYYNNWNFSIDLIKSYLASINRTNIDLVEIGFKSNIKDKTIGLTGNINDGFLKSLNIPKNINIGVMINSSELIEKNNGTNSIKNYFSNYSTKKIKFVRLATHIKDLFKIKNSIGWLKENKFIVAVNIMQISEVSVKKIKRYCEFLKNNKVDVVYLADSLGSLNPNDIKKIFTAFRKNFNGSLGIHAHDNLGLALKNSISAYKNGANWIDSTILGMGRGPGNVKTEELLKRIEKDNQFPKKYKKLESSITKKFSLLKKKYRWGTNQFYRLSGKKEIHPTYIQELLHNKNYSKSTILKVIHNLSNLNVKKYNPLNLHFANNFIGENHHSYKRPKDFLKKSKLLIVGPGKTILKEKNKILDILRNDDFDVIFINKVKNNLKISNFFRTTCHPLRLISDFNFHKSSKDILILPSNNLPKKTFLDLNKAKKKILNYGMKLGNINQIIIKDNLCILPIPLTIGYTISVGFAGNAQKIYLAGFDGRQKDDPYNDATQKIIRLFIKKYGSKRLTSITKTNYIFK
jgi:4-hydroxy 2-oxovalerate aldolase